MSPTHQVMTFSLSVFAGNLRAEMARQHLTSFNLAKTSGIRFSRLNELWRGDRKPTAWEMNKLLEHLKVPVWRLTSCASGCSCQREAES